MRRSNTLNKRLHIEVFGRRYALRGEADQDYAQKLASMVDQKIDEVSQHSEGSPFSKLVVLAAINLADELLQLQEKQNKQDGLTEEKTRRIIESIEEEFEDPMLK